MRLVGAGDRNLKNWRFIVSILKCFLRKDRSNVGGFHSGLYFGILTNTNRFESLNAVNSCTFLLRNLVWMNTTFSFAKYKFTFLISLEADVSEAISEITLSISQFS